MRDGRNFPAQAEAHMWLMISWFPGLPSRQREGANDDGGRSFGSSSDEQWRVVIVDIAQQQFPDVVRPYASNEG